MGFFKKLFKGFKKVFSSKIFKIVGVVVGAAAAIFTAGASLGISAFAGGWGGAVSSLAGSLGLSGTLGTVLTSAVTAAGYGAMTGGALGLVTGGPKGLLEGAGMGLGTGLVTGGIAGGLQAGGVISSNPFNPNNVGVAGSGAPAPGDGLTGLAGKAPAGEAATAAGGIDDAVNAGMAQPSPSAAGAAARGAVDASATTAQAGASGGGTTGLLGNLASNPVIGNTLAGGARGYLQGLAAEDAMEEERRVRDEIRDSYSVSVPTGLHAPRPTDGLPSPVEKYRTRRSDGAAPASVRRQYNPETRRVEEVRIGR